MPTFLRLVRGARIAVVALFLGAGFQNAPAAPFNEQIDFTQPGGAAVQLWGHGDEFYAVFETLEGYTVVFDQVQKAYCYARLSGDRSQLLSTGVQVQNASGTSLGLDQHLRMSPEAVRSQVSTRYAAWDAALDISTRWNALKAAARAEENGAALAPPGRTTVGTKVGLTLLIDFDDAAATIDQTNIEAFCNSDAYTGYGNNGSVKKYYFDNSHGKLTYSNMVTIYIRAPQPKSVYNDTAKDCGEQGRLLITDVLAAMKDLPNFDTEIRPLFNAVTTDANNTAVAFNVFYAGGNGGVWSMGLWPHSWSLASPVELYPGGKKVSRYQLTNIGNKLTIGTFCHENGHMLCGFPDIYDYDYDSIGGAGFFCLMNGGSYGNGGLNPVQICAYLKRAAGWATTVDLDQNSSTLGTVTVAGTNFNRIYRYAKPGTATEYYLLECRFKTNRDATLPASGIAVWHIDELGDRDDQRLTPNSSHHNYEVTLVQADNLWDFEKNKNDGNATDLYYFGNRASGYANELTDSSAPDAHWWDGSPSGLVLRGFSAAAATMSFVVGTDDPWPTILTQPQSQSVVAGYSAHFTVSAAGAAPLAYQWFKSGTSLTGVNSNSFSIAAAQVSDAGGYSVTVSNQFGTVTSAVATLTVIPTVPLPFALNNSNLAWTTSVPLGWYGQTNTSHDAEASAQTPGVNPGEEASLSTTVTGPGTLSFWWKVSSQGTNDFLSFSTGPTEQARISGQLGWEEQTFYLPPTTQSLAWTYSKHSAISNGQDAAWVDQVSWSVGATLPFITLQPQDQSSLGGIPIRFEVAANGTPQLAYQWLFNGSPLSGATGTSFTIYTPDKANNGYYSVRVTNPYGSILSSNAILAVVPVGVAGNDSFGQTRVPMTATEAVAIAAGAWHSLALNADGSVVAWGNNWDGQCAVPPGAWKAACIAAGGYHSLALKTDRTVIGWGMNYSGQATPPPNLANVIAIAAGSWHSLALEANGRVVGWGANTWDQITVPSDLANAIAIAAGGNHSLALRPDGTVAGWGENVNAEGLYVGQSTIPWGLRDVIAIAAGNYHSLALKPDGTIVAWGDNSQGQCDVPADLGRAVAIAAGTGYTLALLADGSIRAWGASWEGQCSPPGGLTNVLAIAAGNSHTVLLVGTPAARPQLESPLWQSRVFTVLLQTCAGRNYSLEYKNSLGTAAWTSLPGIAGNGALQFLVDPNATTPNRWYRVRQW